MIDPQFLHNISIDNISSYYQKKIEVNVLRLDKIHPFISGNKWFKLRFYLEEAILQNKTGILTFGGAWSNHIIATAAACKMKGLRSVGAIRGEEPLQYSPTLVQAAELGMQLIFLSRESYALKQIPSHYQQQEYYVIPEGGFGALGAKGAATILDYTSANFTHCCCATGTGTMMAGLINAKSDQQKIIGITVLKNNMGIEKEISSLIHQASDWQVLHDYSLGGYAKYRPELIAFMNHFYQQTRIPSDFVYTGKLFFAITDLVKKDFFPPGSRLLLIHSGGLQGNSSLRKGTLIF